MIGDIHASTRPPQHPWVRPYMATGGRVDVPRQVPLHTRVTAQVYDGAFAARLQPESRRLYERAYRSTAASAAETLSELAAGCGVPLRVARVLLSDLAAAGRVQIGSDLDASPHSIHLLERVLDGLRQLA
ncbi:DUF742 domain-containing protein [Actinomadura sediminis]|uniref:DUF742 domain-containing protein n=1 Tax=Actinomadura sediminis TaxID=1038904 RepID=A0ABW3EIK5_9ACTN